MMSNFKYKAMKNSWKYILMIAIFMLPLMESMAQNRQQGAQRQRAYTQERTDRAQIPDLTDDQRASMKEFRLDMQKKMLPLRNELGENRAKMRTLTTAESADMKAINKLIDGNADIMAKMMKVRAENHQSIRQMLTEEQRIVLDSKRADFASRDREPRTEEEKLDSKKEGLIDNSS